MYCPVRFGFVLTKNILVMVLLFIFIFTSQGSVEPPIHARREQDKHTQVFSCDFRPVHVGSYTDHWDSVGATHDRDRTRLDYQQH